MAYKITKEEIVELKQTMGFRVGMNYWNEFVAEHPSGCTNEELVALVKKRMNPPYEQQDLDRYLQSILVLFVNFIRGNKLDAPLK